MKRLGSFVLALGLLTACETASGPTKLGRLCTPALPRVVNHYTPPPPPGETRTMRRVAVLPIYGDNNTPESLRDISSAIEGELGKKALFEVVVVSGGELEAICGRRQLSSVEVLPSTLLPGLRDKFGVEGVLFIDLTQLHPYRPVALGLRAKLIDLSNGQIRWASDAVYDSGHPAVADEARDFQRSFSDPSRALPDDGGSVLLSPARFAKFAAFETFKSLQSPAYVSR